MRNLILTTILVCLFHTYIFSQCNTPAAPGTSCSNAIAFCDLKGTHLSWAASKSQIVKHLLIGLEFRPNPWLHPQNDFPEMIGPSCQVSPPSIDMRGGRIYLGETEEHWADTGLLCNATSQGRKTVQSLIYDVPQAKAKLAGRAWG